MNKLIRANPKPLPGMRLKGCTFRLALLISLALIISSLPANAHGQDSNEYRIGVEDVLNIHVWREESISRTVPVRPDGKISLPLLDDIQAAGKTPLELKHFITERLSEFIDDPIVTVIITEHNNFKVFVTGQVRTPGMLRLRSKGTLLQVIPMSGGFTEWADEKKIVVIRSIQGREEKNLVNYKKLIETGSDFELRPGDVIVVP